VLRNNNWNRIDSQLKKTQTQLTCFKFHYFLARCTVRCEIMGEGDQMLSSPPPPRHHESANDLYKGAELFSKNKHQYVRSDLQDLSAIY